MRATSRLVSMPFVRICKCQRAKTMRRDEQRPIPVGNVSGGRNPGAAVSFDSTACAMLSGESRRGTQECARHAREHIFRVLAYAKLQLWDSFQAARRFIGAL